MGRKLKHLPGPSELSKVLAKLNAPPRLQLFNLRSLKLTLAFRNDHFGARHFVKEQLPRIRYANPTLDIQVEKARKAANEVWRPEMEIEFIDGQQHTLDLHEKWSTTIIKELMELAGGDSWFQWKAQAAAAGLPVVPGEEKEHLVVKRPAPNPLPSLKMYRTTLPTPPPPPDSKAKSKERVKEKVKGVVVMAKVGEETMGVPLPPPSPKTGAAAVLP